MLESGQCNTGDFSILDEDQREFKTPIGCANLKSEQYTKRQKVGRPVHVEKAMSAGVLALIASCGLFASIKELIQSESLQQAWSCSLPPHIHTLGSTPHVAAMPS